MSLFPITAFTPKTAQRALPLYRDVAWDSEADAPVFSAGEPVFVTGIDAVKSWALRALATPRYRHAIFDRSYGCELENLVGQPYRADTKLSEAARYVEEALLISPYIKAVSISEAGFEDGKFKLSAELSTIYGKERIYV